MRAFSPTGIEIRGTADKVPANALVNDFTRLPDGTIGLEWALQTDMCWNGQYTCQRGGPRDAADEMLAALKAIHQPYASLTEEALRDGVLMEHGPPKPEKGAALFLVRAAIAKAELPSKDLFVDEDGIEWPEDEIVLLDGDKMDAASQVGYEVGPTDNDCFKAHLIGHGDVGIFPTFAEAWAAVLKKMEGRVSEP